MRGEAAWSALEAAMRTETPLCVGDDRFVADDLTPADRLAMADLCNMCPIRQACAEYARAGRPDAGFWAGKETNR